MGETQAILKKIESTARERLEKTKELLKGYLNRNLEPEKEPEEDEWDYS